MKVAVSASGAGLKSPVDARFGRCAWFIVVDTDTGDFEAFPNPGLEAPQGAGISAAQFVVSKGAQAVLTGRCGPKAYQALEAAGVTIVGGADGTSVLEALDRYKAGALRPLSGPTAAGGGF